MTDVFAEQVTYELLPLNALRVPLIVNVQLLLLKFKLNPDSRFKRPFTVNLHLR